MKDTSQIYPDFVQTHKEKLLFSFFPYRNYNGGKLLHLGLNSDIQPGFFSDLGILVSAIAGNQQELKENQELNKEKNISYYLAKSPPYPFDDFTFDTVALIHCLHNPYPEDILSEACRLASQSVLILEYNSFCMNPISPHISPIKLFSLIKENCPDMSMTFRSTLYSPLFLAKKIALLNTPLPLPLGSLLAIKLGQPQIPLSPVGALEIS